MSHAGTTPDPATHDASYAGTHGEHSVGHHTGQQHTRSIGEIVGDISADLSTLVRQEMDLAKSELKQEIGKVGKGAGMFGGAGVSALLMLIFASLALTYLLDNWMPVELAALIVAVLWGIAAAVLAARGRKEVKEADPQLPVTQRTLKEDVQWAREQKS